MTEILIWPSQQEGDFTIADFTFENGGTLEELNLHYITLGTQGFDSNGKINNALLLLHNTTGSGRTWLEPGLANELFGTG